MTDSNLPARAGDIIKFTPECAKDREPPPVYKLLVPSLSQRATYERDVIAAGAAFPDFPGMMATMRRAIAEVIAGEENQAAAHEIVDAYESTQRDGGSMPEVFKALAAYGKLEAEITRLHVPYARHVAQVRFYNSISQILALSHFLVGWEKMGLAAADFVREGGVTAESTLGLIPIDEYPEVAARALSLIRLSQAASKKSAPPASSPSSPSST